MYRGDLRLWFKDWRKFQTSKEGQNRPRPSTISSDLPSFPVDNEPEPLQAAHSCGLNPTAA
jgi:hypothetical protein